MTQPVPNGFLGHPRGLMTLFFVEMWERFSYYGMRALLILYMTLPVANGGLGFSVAKGGLIYSVYTFSVYALGLPGGWVADRFIGYRKAVLFGGVLLALGHFSLAFSGESYFYSGLVLIAVGTGLLKTNATSIVGLLYDKNDTARRDSGYTIYYLGINLGAMLAPLVTGFMAQSETFGGWLKSAGIRPEMGWHFAFGAAGVSMVLGLTQYLVMQRSLGSVGVLPRGGETRAAAASAPPLSRSDWHRIGVICILIAFATIFWATFEQAGTTLNLFADRLTANTLFGFDFPSTWFQSVNSAFILILGSVMAALWVRLGRRNPSSPVKFALALFLVGGGMALLIPASQIASSGVKVSPMWLIGTYFIHTVGELCLSPIGQSLTSRIAPARVQGLMMGAWFMSLAFGNLVAGNVGGLFETISLTTIFATIFAVTTLAAIVILVLKPLLRRWTGDQPEPSAAH
jgi:proton-dependent oligopeptide transporter, POT family